MAIFGTQLVNTDPNIPTDDSLESQLPAFLREFKLDVLSWVDIEHYRTGKHKRPYGVASGLVNQYTVAIPHCITSLDAGFSIDFTPHTSNTGPSTLSVTADVTPLGTAAIKKGAQDLEPGDLQGGRAFRVIFDGNVWQLLFAPHPVSTVIGFTFIPRVIVDQKSGSGTKPFTVFDAAPHVPVGTSAVILQARARSEGHGTTASILVRKDNASDQYALLRLSPGVGGVVGIGGPNGIFPIAPDRTFQYSIETPGFTHGYRIDLTGYFGI
jgi:hypothetical protein